jgi:peptide deformylase
MSGQETELKIKTLGAPVIRQKALPIKKVNQDHRATLSRMAQLMYDAGGIGLAAPQVGLSQAMIVVDIGSGLYKLINPQVIRRKGSQVNQEGCLSVPGICVKVKRSRDVVVEAIDENGEALAIEATGLLACVLQHEMDHLRGRLIVDYASLVEKVKLAPKIRELKKKSRNEESFASKTSSSTKSCPLQL